PTAIAYYKEAKRYALTATAYADVDQAKDAMKTLRTRPEALPVAGLGDEAAQVMLKSGDKKVEYVFTRKGSLIAGATDDPHAKDEHLTKDEKIAKLKAWLAGSAAPATSGSTAKAPAPAPSAK